MAYEVKERVWVTQDKSRAVPEGSPEAAWLYAKPGDVLSDEEAERLGLKRRKAEPEDKKRKGAKDK